MSSLIADLAGSIVTKLNAEAFSLPFDATREYHPVIDVQELSTLHVTVVPKSAEYATANRTQLQADPQIDIGILKKLDTGDDAEELAETDSLMALVEEIVQFMFDTRAFGDARYLGAENAPIVSQEHLGKRLFVSVLTVTFRVVKP